VNSSEITDIQVSSSERVKRSKKIVILIVLRDAEDQGSVILELSGAAHQTEHHIPENVNPQERGCVRSLPPCLQKELFKKYGL
jgi:hypothetical protein